MNSHYLTVKFPDEFRNWGDNNNCRFDKVQVIKSIRMLTGWGLKESKDATEQHSLVELPIRAITESEYEAEIKILKQNGVEIGNTLSRTIQSNLEDMAIQALRNKEYNLAIDLIEFIKNHY